MQEIDTSLFPSSKDIWYAGQLKAFAARLPAVAHHYDLPTVMVLRVQDVALEFMELLIHRMHYAADYLRHQPHAVGSSLPIPLELSINWQDYKQLLQEFMQELVGHIEQHAAYTTAAGRALNLTMLTGQPPCSVRAASLQARTY